MTVRIGLLLWTNSVTHDHTPYMQHRLNFDKVAKILTNRRPWRWQSVTSLWHWLTQR